MRGDEIVGYYGDGTPMTVSDAENYLIGQWEVDSSIFRQYFGADATKRDLYKAVSRVIQREHRTRKRNDGGNNVSK